MRSFIKLNLGHQKLYQLAQRPSSRLAMNTIPDALKTVLDGL